MSPSPTRLATAACLVFHLVSAGCFVVFLFHLSLATLAFFVVAAVFVVTAYNTVWYHRYCSHRAFEFEDVRWTRLFLFTNPLCFREEGYLLAHRQHHALSDQPGDPYGPHLGRLGSYLAIEWMQNYDTSMSEAKYASLARTLRHLDLELNDHDGFRRQGSFERLSAFALRTLFAQLLWAVPIYALGGASYLLAWFAALFVVMLLMRDFNYAGHGGGAVRPGVEFDGVARARNQRFYGYFGAEWHNHHHRFPRSARCGFSKGQPDLAFSMIRGLHRLGIVRRYRDDGEEARRELAAAHESARGATT